MIEVHVIRVFTSKQGRYGSPAGVVIDEESKISPEKRQAIAKQLGFSETVFVNKKSPTEVSIYGLQSEVNFAGAPLLGTAWLLSKMHGSLIDSITCNGKQIKVLEEDTLTWIIVDDLEGTPPWHHKQLKNYQEIEQLSVDDEPYKEHTYAWAWIDEGLRVARVRARTFAPDWDIPEEEANGSGSMQLAHRLGRNLEIIHGKGSLIRASVGSTGIAIGGWVKEDPKVTI
jgi:predicted PhzF superfamily epimerase YddE/YHI9